MAGDSRSPRRHCPVAVGAHCVAVVAAAAVAPPAVAVAEVGDGTKSKEA